MPSFSFKGIEYKSQFTVLLNSIYSSLDWTRDEQRDGANNVSQRDIKTQIQPYEAPPLQKSPSFLSI